MDDDESVGGWHETVRMKKILNQRGPGWDEMGDNEDVGNAWTNGWLRHYGPGVHSSSFAGNHQGVNGNSFGGSHQGVNSNSFDSSNDEDYNNEVGTRGTMVNGTTRRS